MLSLHKEPVLWHMTERIEREENLAPHLIEDHDLS